MPYKVAIRCDAGPEVGLGHVVRCVALAEALRERQCDVQFYMTDGEEYIPETYRVYISDQARPADAVVLDLPADTTYAWVLPPSKRRPLVVALDTLHIQEADLCFYPPTPDVLDRFGGSAPPSVYVGYDWVVLRRDVCEAQREAITARGVRNPTDGKPRVLVTMGGSDPQNLAAQVAAALETIPHDLYAPTFLLGPGYDSRLLPRGYATRRVVSLATGQSPVSEFADADLAICKWGVTAYELAALGVPAVYYCDTPDQERDASTLDFALCGVIVRPDNAAQVIRELLESAPWRASLAAAGPRLVDGRGAERVADVIVARLEERANG